MNRSLSGSIALTKLISYRTTMNNKKGEPVEVLVLPLAANHLVSGKEGAVYMPVRVYTKDEEDQYGQHGFISQSVDSKVYKEATEEQREEYKKLPILGNLKDFAGYQADTGGLMEEKLEPTNIGADDLPF